MDGAGGYAAARSVADQLSSLPPPHTSSDMNRAEKAALWSASERLEARAARDGRTAPPVAEEEWHVDTVHNVLLQFVSYAPTAGEPPPSAAFLTFQFFHFEPRTTPKALLEPPLSDGYRPTAPGGGGGGGGAQATLEGQQRAAAQGGGAVRGRQDALRLDVGLLTLGSGVLRDSQVGDLWVEIDVPGRDSLPPLRTAAVKKAMSGRVELGYTHTEELPRGGRQAQELLKALRSRDEQDADVYFTLKTREGSRGPEKELGQGFVNLHEMLKANKDVVQQGIRLHGKLGNVGTLAVSLLAVRAARALLEGGGGGGDAPARGGAAEFLDGLKPGGGGGGVGGAEAEAAAAAAGGAPVKEQELSLVAADPALAREGPGLVERFLLQPPAEGREEATSAAGNAST